MALYPRRYHVVLFITTAVRTSHSANTGIVGFEVLTVVVVKNSIFSGI
jgi:hypothetical protein